MPTLVLSQRYSNDSNDMWRKAVEKGWEVCRVHGFQFPPELSGQTLVYYGETLLADAFLQNFEYNLVQPDDAWLSYLPPSYLARKVEFLSLRQALERKERAFYKPAEEKLFPAAIYNQGSELPVPDNLEDEFPVLVSEPVNFSIEYRFFVAQRQIKTGSPYVLEGNLAKDEHGTWLRDPEQQAQATDFLEKMLQDSNVKLPPALVIDVGLLSNQTWAVVEANAAWASGLCDCDSEGVLEVLSEACVPNDKIETIHPRWLRPSNR
jgi:hypothetical protein